MKPLGPIFCMAFLVGCVSPVKKWAAIDRGSNLTPQEVTEALGTEPKVRQEHKKVFLYSKEGWFEGNVTVYRYDFGSKKNGREEYAEFYFDGDRYLSDTTTMPMMLN